MGNFVANIPVKSGLSAGLEGNGYSVTVSAEGHGSVNELVPHHRVVSGVVRDAQTSALWSHTRVQSLGCVLGSGEQRVTETSSK